MNRRSLLELLGLAAASAAGQSLISPSSAASRAKDPWPRVRGPIPLPSDGLSARAQRATYEQVTLLDRLEVPPGYQAEVLLSWGDRLGNTTMGFNNDYLAFTPIGTDRALLTINYEYITAKTWCGGYQEAKGRSLPFESLAKALKETGGTVDVGSLTSGSPLRAMAKEVATAALEDLGIGVASLVKDNDGAWRHQPSAVERRIHGLSGYTDPAQRLTTTGPAASVFVKTERLGYDDGLGDRIVGTFANCAGGQTPWGTVLSAEENFQNQVVEAVYADGSSADPSLCPFEFTDQKLEGLGNPFGLAGNKYGWMVEIDPKEPQKRPVKHTWLGRFRHEAVAIRAKAGEPLVVYSACDRHGGHLYRFVSDQPLRDPKDPNNSRLFESGRLEVAQLERNGKGRWLPLRPDTSVDPTTPDIDQRLRDGRGVQLPHSDRSQAGGEKISSNEQLKSYCNQFARLGDLYSGNANEQMGAILIDAHLAANAIGATPTARPEDTDIDPITGDLLVAFTMAGSDEAGSADTSIFRGPQGESPWAYGWVMRLSDGKADPQKAGGNFNWRMAATGGTPWEGGMGFANPDNLAVDQRGNVWMLTDRSSSSTQTEIFGRNGCWILPRQPDAGKEAVLFASGPIEAELCGPCFDSDEHTLFLAVQHPGERHGCHLKGEVAQQVFSLKDRDGVDFKQVRNVPLGSNWPSGVPGRQPRPSIVSIRRNHGGPLVAKA